MKTRTKTLLTTLTASAMLSASVSAAVITPTAASAPGSLDAPRTLTETIDGSGLSDVSDPTSVLDDTHIDHNSGGNSGTTYWLSENGDPVATGYTLSYTLGDTYDLTGIYLWQYSRSGDTDRGIKTFDIWVSSDGTNFTEAVTSATLGDFTIADGSDQSVQTKTFSSISGVTHVELRNLNNFGDATFYGLSELRFEGVPEPGSLALLGLGGVLIGARRRRGS